MQEATARELARLTSAFYAQVSDSFSATRQAPWPGWETVLDLARRRMGMPRQLRVVDVACGNLRFERHLAGELAKDDIRLQVCAYDSCDDLVLAEPVEGAQVSYRHLDLAEALFAGEDLAAQFARDQGQLVVCFGFMHHLALPEHRARLLEALVAAAAPGGLVAVSFWQLSRSDRLLAKAQATTAKMLPVLGIGPLDEGDYLLGWQRRTDVLRYCHDFSEAQIDELVASVAPVAREVARFSADGATGNLNRYVVLER